MMGRVRGENIRGRDGIDELLRSEVPELGGRVVDEKREVVTYAGGNIVRGVGCGRLLHCTVGGVTVV